MSNLGENTDARTPAFSIIKKTSIEELTRQVIIGGIAAVSALALWLWGWVAGGGLTKVIGGVPPGAIMAFKTKCPTELGWSPFNEGTGRFVVGAGADYAPGFDNWARALTDGEQQPVSLSGTSFKLMDHGGEINHLISVAELPHFSIPINAFFSQDFHRGKGGYLGTWIVGDEEPDHPPPLSPGFTEGVRYSKGVGGGQPASVMPPYIALNYCQKG